MDYRKLYGLDKYDCGQCSLSVKQEVGRVITCYNSRNIEIVTTKGIKKGITATKILKFQDKVPVPGDWVIVQQEENDFSVIVEIIPRKNEFIRKSAGGEFKNQIIGVNLDKIFLVTSMNQDFNPRRIERYIAQAQACNIKLIIVLSKSDLADNPLEFVELAQRIYPDGTVIQTTAIDGKNGLSSLYPYLIQGETVAFVGASGAGKSTIMNTLLGYKAMAVNKISESTGKGCHTTTRRELIALDNGTLLLDTPGMREFGVILSSGDFQAGFDDILSWAEYCFYSDCSHRKEERCAVRMAVENGLLSPKRLDNYIKIMQEQDFLWIKGRRMKKTKLKYPDSKHGNNKGYKREKINFQKEY